MNYLLEQDSDEYHYGLYYANTISLMEKYLQDVFLHEIKSCRKKLLKLASKTKLSQQTLPLPYALNNSIEDYIINLMQNMVWHRLNDIDIFYKQVLDIKLNITGDIIAILKVRHDIVHRNSYDLHNQKLVINRELFQKSAMAVQAFVVDIDKKYQRVKSNE